MNCPGPPREVQSTSETEAESLQWTYLIEFGLKRSAGLAGGVLKIVLPRAK